MAEQVILSYHLQRQCGNVRPHSTKCGNTWAVDDIENWACETQPPPVICSKAGRNDGQILECAGVEDRVLPPVLVLNLSSPVGGCFPMTPLEMPMFPDTPFPWEGAAYATPWYEPATNQCTGAGAITTGTRCRFRLSVGCASTQLVFEWDSPGACSTHYMTLGVGIGFVTPVDGNFSYEVVGLSGTTAGGSGSDCDSVIPFCGWIGAFSFGGCRVTPATSTVGVSITVTLSTPPQESE